MSTTHSLDNLKRYHNEATQFFGSELMLLKEVITKIVDDRLAKAAVLLISCGQTGAALLQLANQTDRFTSESVMLARSFMERITNFCYLSVCDENEYRAFILHPIYKHPQFAVVCNSCRWSKFSLRSSILVTFTTIFINLPLTI